MRRSGMSGGGFGSGRVSGPSRAAGPVLGDSRRHVQTGAECLRVRAVIVPARDLHRISRNLVLLRAVTAPDSRPERQSIRGRDDRLAQCPQSGLSTGTLSSTRTFAQP